MRQLLDSYKVDNLVGISPEEFEEELMKMTSINDYEMEGLDSLEAQRLQSIEFTWGHTHNFGTFKMQGLMRDRHFTLAERYNRHVDLKALVKGKEVLDVGCWTGGAALMYAAMGAKTVVAIDEVLKYVEALYFLRSSFDIDALFPSHASIYNPALVEKFRERFDVVSCSGVLYHITDMVVALRILRNVLKPGGVLLLETAGIKSVGKIARYEGHLQGKWPGNQGWNWWFPSMELVEQMLIDVGFNEINLDWHPNNRIQGIALRTLVDKPMMQAGISLSIENKGGDLCGLERNEAEE